jgi:AcrR family transcriptional regulator
MTIRSLASDLGVAPMSLYQHVRDKDDLLDEVVDRLLSRAWQPRAKQRDWQIWTIEAADKLRHFLVTQPAALEVYLRHPVVSPAAIARMNAMMARRAYGAIHTYTIGFAALEASRAKGQPRDTTCDMAMSLAAYTTSGQFTISIRYLLEGIRRDGRARAGSKAVRALNPGV